MIAQNVWLCLCLSSLGAISTQVSKVSILYMSRRLKAVHEELHSKKIDLDETSRKSLSQQNALSVFIFGFFTLVANFFLFLAPWAGPVSVYWPTYVACQLIANVLLVGALLRLETFDKPSQVATLIVLTSVLYININGPTSQKGQDIKKLVVGNWIAIGWLSALVLVFCISSMFMLSLFKHDRRQSKVKALEEDDEVVIRRKPSPLVIEGVLWLVSITCSTLCSSTSKAASLLTEPEDYATRIGLIGVSWFFLSVWVVENYLEGRHVRSLGVFQPIVIFGGVMTNAATGMLVWEDYKTVVSWAGYATALFSLGLGVYLISDLDFFRKQAQQQQEYHRNYYEDIDEFFRNIERELVNMSLEQSFGNYHTQTAVQGSGGSSHRGLYRIASDPELGTKTRPELAIEDATKTSMTWNDADDLASIDSSRVVSCERNVLLQVSPGSTSTMSCLTMPSSRRGSIENLQVNLSDLKEIIQQNILGGSLPSPSEFSSISTRRPGRGLSKSAPGQLCRKSRVVMVNKSETESLLLPKL